MPLNVENETMNNNLIYMYLNFQIFHAVEHSVESIYEVISIYDILISESLQQFAGVLTVSIWNEKYNISLFPTELKNY